MLFGYQNSQKNMFQKKNKKKIQVFEQHKSE